METLRRILRYRAFFAVVLALGAAVWSYAAREATTRLADRARADLTWASDRLAAQLFRHRELAVVLARHPDLLAVLEGRGDVEVARDLILAMSDMTGAEEIDLFDADGALVLRSQALAAPRAAEALPLSRALRGALGTGHQVTEYPDRPARRAFAFAAPVFDAGGKVAGAVLVEANVRHIEENWPGNAPAVFFTEPGGRVIVSNRSELVLGNLLTGAGFPPYRVETAQGHELWSLDGGPYLPARALHLAIERPVIGLGAHILVATGEAERSAALQAATAMALLLVVGGVIELIWQNRRALARRLRLEAEANARLEDRVQARTRALSEANASLTREVAERKEAEAALKRAQGELVQASKLAALGKMSAGISHELNQPLMAIRSFAENAGAFLERDRVEEARANLGRIAELARRMGRIIQNLRAFARAEPGPVADVDLGAVIASALETAGARFAAEGVALDWAPPRAPVRVRGGEVRLEQVLVNVIGNALDAMAEAPERRLGLTLDAGPDRVRLLIEDTGPGIEEPERVFDPFYSTKNVGAAEGMGLGLSISYGLVQGFGGRLLAENRPEGGARFTLELLPGQGEKAA